jgi:hypothetical protein
MKLALARYGLMLSGAALASVAIAQPGGDQPAVPPPPAKAVPLNLHQPKPARLARQSARGRLAQLPPHVERLGL